MNHSKIRRIRTPNPYFENDVNAYLIPGTPCTLVDTGIGTEEAWVELQRGARQAGVELEEIDQIILTHKHPDHFGLAGRIQRLSGARIFIHEADLPGVTGFSQDYDHWLSRILEKLRSWHAPPELLDRVRRELQETEDLAESIQAEALRDGQVLPLEEADLEVLHTPGHTLGSICLRYASTLLTGDHVLPTYTPNIGGSDWDGDDLLEQFLHSLERLRALSQENGFLHVLPGHGDPIESLSSRIEFMLEHHRSRSRRILGALEAEELNTWEIARRMFGSLEGIHVLLGLGEIDAHLEYLSKRGHVDSRHNAYSLAPGTDPTGTPEQTEGEKGHLR